MILLSTAKFSEGRYYDSRNSSFNISYNFPEISNPIKTEEDFISLQIEDKINNTMINIFQTTSINYEEYTILITKMKDKYNFSA